MNTGFLTIEGTVLKKCDWNAAGKIVIPEGVTKIGGMAFRGCSSLTEIVIPNSVTEIGEWAFHGCSSLTEIVIPKGVTKIGRSAFYDCLSLTEIVIPKSVTVIDSSAFDGCTSLTKVVIPESVTEIGKSAFSECKSLTEIVIPASVKEISTGAFEKCSSLESIVVDSNNKVYDSRNNCNAIIQTESNTLFAGCKNTIIPESVTQIGNSAFNGCSSLTEIVIPNSVTKIGGMAFRGCSSLTEIVITEGVTEIETAAFRDCLSLTKVVIPENITKIGLTVFMGCSALESIVVDSNNKVYDSRNNCNAIIHTESNTLIAGCKNAIIPEGVTEIGFGAFYSCSSLTEIVIPNSVTKIGNRAFDGCSSLTEIVIPEGVTEISANPFEGCTSLESIVIDSNNKVYDSRNNCNAIIHTESNTLIAGCKNTIIPEGVTVIGKEAFKNCTSLTKIVIPESVTEIGDDAFSSCNSLAEIVIPEGVTKIGKEAFSWCKSLKKVSMPERFKGKEDEILDRYRYPRPEIHFQSSSKVTSSPKATSKDENRDEKEKMCLEYLKEKYRYSVYEDNYLRPEIVETAHIVLINTRNNRWSLLDPSSGCSGEELKFVFTYVNRKPHFNFSLDVWDNVPHDLKYTKICVKFNQKVIIVDETYISDSISVLYDKSYCSLRISKEDGMEILKNIRDLYISIKSPTYSYEGWAKVDIDDAAIEYMLDPVAATDELIDTLYKNAVAHKINKYESNIRSIKFEITEKDGSLVMNSNFINLLDGKVSSVNKLRHYVKISGQESTVLNAIDEILNMPNISKIKKEISEHPGKVEKKAKFAFLIILIIALVFTIPAALLEMWWLIIGAIVIEVVFLNKYSIAVPLSPEATKLIDRVNKIKYKY